MGALNLPSAADIERVTRRLRSVSQRLEGIEDAIDRLEERVAAAGGAGADDRLGRIESRLDEISARRRRARERSWRPASEPMPRAQERLTVTDCLSGRVAGLAEPHAELGKLVPASSAARRSTPRTSVTPSTQAAATPRRAATWRIVAASISTATAPRSAQPAAAPSRGS